MYNLFVCPLRIRTMMIDHTDDDNDDEDDDDDMRCWVKNTNHIKAM